MNHNRYTSIHFDYEGYYSKNEKDVQWISTQPIYTILIKKYMEEVTYSDLVANVYRKTKIYEGTTKLRMSYIPMEVNPRRPSYILNDKDVLGFVMTVDGVQLRNLLFVELINQGCEILPSEQTLESYADKVKVWQGSIDRSCHLLDTNYKRNMNGLDQEGSESPTESIGSNEVEES